MEVVEKPWGFYEVLVDEPTYKVKRITIKPNQSLSLQYHGYRDEIWICVEGLIDTNIKYRDNVLNYGMSVEIPKGIVHRATNKTINNVSFIEIQTGDKLLEEDIIRLRDKYGR